MQQNVILVKMKTKDKAVGSFMPDCISVATGCKCPLSTSRAPGAIPNLHAHFLPYHCRVQVWLCLQNPDGRSAMNVLTPSYVYLNTIQCVHYEEQWVSDSKMTKLRKKKVRLF